MFPSDIYMSVVDRSAGHWETLYDSGMFTVFNGSKTSKEFQDILKGEDRRMYPLSTKGLYEVRCHFYGPTSAHLESTGETLIHLPDLSTLQASRAYHFQVRTKGPDMIIFDRAPIELSIRYADHIPL